MDDDLKIVISTELEADEAKSVQRISKQLPTISEGLEKKDHIKVAVGVDVEKSADKIAKQLKEIGDLVNTKGTIKVGVVIDEAKVRAQSQQIARDVQNATKSQNIPISLNLDESPVDRLKKKLRDLAMSYSSDIDMSVLNRDIDLIVDDLAKAVDKVDNISHSILEADSEMEDFEGRTKRILSLTVQGTNAAGDTVSVVKNLNLALEDLGHDLADQEDKTLSIGNNVVTITERTKQQRQEQERLNKATEDREAYLIRQRQVLESIRGVWEGKTAAVGVGDSTHIKDLEDNYRVIASLMDVLSNESGRLGKEQRAGIEAALSALKNLVVEYRNAESAATDLRTRSVDTSKDVDTAGLIKFERDLKTAGMMTKEFQQQIDALKVELNGVADGDGLQAFLDKFEVLKARVQAFKADAGLADKVSDVNARLETTRATVETIQYRAAALSNPTENLKINVSELAGLLEAVDKADTDSGRIRAFNELQKKIRDCRTELTALNQSQNLGIRDVRFTSGLEKAKADLATIARTWSAFKSDPGLNRQFEQLQANLRAVNDQPGLTKWTAQFNAFKSEIKAAGLNVQSLGDTLKNNLGKVMQWVSATTMLFRAFRLLKEGVKTVIDLDTAMIDLRKTTNATEAEYAAFYKTANETAKRLNVTTEAVISQSAAWSRLGYDIQTAAKLAEASSILRMISPSMSEDQSQSGLVSIIKAFGYQDMDNILDDIISKINIIGNTKALSNVDVVEILTRSSAAMAAANNTLEETISLGVAAQEIVQSAEVVGTGLKTLSLRIRGYDESTEEYSDDVAMLTGKIADLTKTAKTAGGISLFEADNPDQYKSTYQILKEISEIWGDLTDKNQAQLLEALFGKRQAQIGAAILTNFKQAEQSMEDMQHAAGNAEAEMSVIMDSVEYRLNALGQTWVGVSQALFQTDDLKSVISVLQTLSDVVAGVTDRFGLFGTIGIGGFVTALYQITKTAGGPKLTGSCARNISPVRASSELVA